MVKMPKIPKPSKKNIAPAAISILPFGQVFARIFFLDGSLDKWWLLIPIFLIPPFSLVAFFLILFGFVDKGKGGKPYDLYIALPMVFAVLFKIFSFIKVDFFHTKIFKSIEYILILGTLMFALLYKRHKSIQKINKEPEKCDSTFNPKILTNEFVNSVVLFGISVVLLLFIKFIAMGLLLKTGKIKAVSKVNNIIDLIFFPIALWCVYVFNNMIKGSDYDKLCTPDWNIKDKSTWIPFIFSLIGIIFSIMFSKPSDFSKAKDNLSNVKNNLSNLKKLDIAKVKELAKSKIDINKVKKLAKSKVNKKEIEELAKSNLKKIKK